MTEMSHKLASRDVSATSGLLPESELPARYEDTFSDQVVYDIETILDNRRW
jgi:hypothetical protein